LQTLRYGKKQTIILSKIGQFAEFEKCHSY